METRYAVGIPKSKMSIAAIIMDLLEILGFLIFIDKYDIRKADRN